MMCVTPGIKGWATMPGPGPIPPTPSIPGWTGKDEWTESRGHCPMNYRYEPNKNLGMKHLMSLLVLMVLMGCKETEKTDKGTDQALVEEPVPVQIDSLPQETKLKSFEGLADTTFVRLADFSDDFAYDMRYATENNFLKAKVYDCAECYTRVKTAKAATAANCAFTEKGVRIKFSD